MLNILGTNIMTKGRFGSAEISIPRVTEPRFLDCLALPRGILIPRLRYFFSTTQGRNRPGIRIRLVRDINLLRNSDIRQGVSGDRGSLGLLSIVQSENVWTVSYP